MITCSKCGAVSDDGVKFCRVCGTPLTAAPQQEQFYQQPAPQQGQFYQQPAPQQEQFYQQPVPQQGQIYQQPAPQQGQFYQQPAPRQEQFYQQPALQQGQFYQQPAPQQGQFYQQPVPQQGQFYQQPAPINIDFSAIPVRRMCPNGHLTDGRDGQTACPQCGAPFVQGGIIHIYRMGNFMGMAVGMGLYIDGVPYGHLGNKKSIRVVLPYGPHQIHMTHTTTRFCNDPVFYLTPEDPYICCKAHFAKGGFTVAVERVAPESLPTK